jgi:hypothetical protein
MPVPSGESTLVDQGSDGFGAGQIERHTDGGLVRVERSPVQVIRPRSRQPLYFE